MKVPRSCARDQVCHGCAGRRMMKYIRHVNVATCKERVLSNPIRKYGKQNVVQVVTVRKRRRTSAHPRQNKQVKYLTQDDFRKDS